MAKHRHGSHFVIFHCTWHCQTPKLAGVGSEVLVLNGVQGKYEHTNAVLLAMALAFAGCSLLLNLLVIYLCFVPYVYGWIMKDVVHGRCDQYAVDPVTGKRFVPASYISLVNILQMAMIFVSIAALASFSHHSDLANFSAI